MMRWARGYSGPDLASAPIGAEYQRHLINTKGVAPQTFQPSNRMKNRMKASHHMSTIIIQHVGCDQRTRQRHCSDPNSPFLINQNGAIQCLKIPISQPLGSAPHRQVINEKGEARAMFSKSMQPCQINDCNSLITRVNLVEKYARISRDYYICSGHHKSQIGMVCMMAVTCARLIS